MGNIFSELSENLSESFNSITEGFNFTNIIEDLSSNVLNSIPQISSDQGQQLFDEVVSNIDLLDLGNDILD